MEVDVLMVLTGIFVNVSMALQDLIVELVSSY